MTIIRELFQLIINIFLTFIQSICSCLKPKELKNFNEQVIVITGSAHGIGKELALIFHKLGAKLALIDINQSLNEELVEYLKSQNSNKNKNENFPNVIGYKCDLTNESEIEDIVGQILLDFGQVDILINNAGFVRCAPLLELTKNDIKQTFNVNILSHFWLIKQLLPIMIDRKIGHIVAISSIAGLSGTANLVDYCASKHAIVGMMTALDCELRAKKLDFIKLTTICPLAIATGMFKRPKTRFNFLLPILTPEQVAEQILMAINSDKFLITIPRYAFLFVLLEKIVPRDVYKIVEKFLQYEVGKH